MLEQTFTIEANNGFKYNQRAGSKTEAIAEFEETHAGILVARIQNEDEAIMESLNKGFE